MQDQEKDGIQNQVAPEKQTLEASKNEVSTSGSSKVAIPEEVWRGINAVRKSGLTNMLDRPMVAKLAQKLGFPEASNWINDNPKKYAEGVFRGFIKKTTK